MPDYVAVPCPKCSAPLPKGEAELVCPYCGSRLKFEDPDQNLGGDNLVRRGVRAYKAGEPRKAIPDLERGLTLPHPENKTEDILTVIGLCYEDAGNYEKSIQYHQRAIDQNPAHYKAWVNQGVAYRKSGNFDRAEACYQQAIQLNPNYAELHSSLGVLYTLRDEAQRALAPLERAIALDPSVGSFYANLALALAMLDRFDEAEAALKKSIMRGYRKHAVVRDRIEALKALKKG